MKYYINVIKAVSLTVLGMVSLTFAAQENDEKNSTPSKRPAGPVYYESPLTPPVHRRRMPSSAQKDPNFSLKRVLFKEENHEPVQQLITEGTVDRWPSIWDQTKNDDLYIKRLAALALADGTTLLHLAMRKNHVHCITDLIRYGEVDLTAKIIKSLSTPLHEWAMDLHRCSQGQAEMVAEVIKDILVRTHTTFPDKALLGNDNGSTPLHVVCSMHKRNPYIFKALIAAGHPINVVNNRGQSILHYLAFNDGDLHNLLPLILNELSMHSFRSILNHQDFQKKTALHRAVENRSRIMFDFLMNQIGIKRNRQDTLGQTPLHIVAELMLGDQRNDAKYFYDRLIVTGADQTLTNYYGETAADILTHD